MSTIIRRRSREMDTFLKSGRTRLVGEVERFVKAQEPEFRRWDILHPSALSKSDWCPRANYFVVISQDPPAPERISLRTQNVFDEGHAIHDKWQRRFWKMGALYGRWRCLVCEHTWWATSPSFCQQLTCQSPLIRYAEVPLENPAWIIAGHADGWIKGIGADCLIELKSVGSGTVRYESPSLFERWDGDFEQIWKNIKRPFPSHLRQGQIYLRVLNETVEDAPQEVVFIYESKFDQSYKEFTVPYNPSLTDEIVERAIVVKEAVDAGKAPRCPHGGCSYCRGLK